MKRGKGLTRKTRLRQKARPTKFVALDLRHTGYEPASRPFLGPPPERPTIFVSDAPRQVAPPIEKRGDVLGPSYLAWVRAQPCEFPRSKDHPHDPGHGGGDPHHEPTVGSSGGQLDPLVAAACRCAHQLCDVAPYNGGWTADQKQAAGYRTWTRFIHRAPRQLRETVLSEMLGAQPVHQRIHE